MKPGIDHVGVSVSFWCHDGDFNFLLHRRSDRCRDEHGRWDFGAGGLEFGEHVRAGLLRELREEYGCLGVIEQQMPAHSIIRTHEGQTTHWIAIPHVVRVDREKARPCEPEMVTAYGWFPLWNLPEPLHEGVQQTLSQIGPLFAPYGWRG